jgi:thiamine biosynthesis lipoprotein
VIALALCLFAQASAPAHKFVREGKAMGTLVTFTAWTGDDAAAEKAFNEAFAELGRIEDLMTDWPHPGVSPSDVLRINAAAGNHPVKVAPETLEVIQAAQDMSRRSSGAFDITFAAMHGLWKFDQDLEARVPSPAEVAQRRKLVDYREVKVDPQQGTVFLRKAGMRIGLGGIAKGYAVDRCVAVLRKRGLANFMVQAGGDLFVAGSRGPDSWQVGIKDPRGSKPFAVAPISDHAFSTAGDYERGFVLKGRRYHHIIDPKTGYPATASRSVTIFARSALEADALDDSVFILGPQKGLALVESFAGAGAVIVDAHNKVWVSPRVKDTVKIKRPPTDGV